MSIRIWERSQLAVDASGFADAAVFTSGPGVPDATEIEPGDSYTIQRHDTRFLMIESDDAFHARLDAGGATTAVTALSSPRMTGQVTMGVEVAVSTPVGLVLRTVAAA